MPLHSRVSEQADENISRSDRSTPGDAKEEVWVSVVEPVTIDTLLDTCLAELGVIKTLCELSPPESIDELISIEQRFQDKLSDQINLYSQNPERRKDSVLSKTSFLCSFANAQYRLRVSDLSTYEHDFNAYVQESEAYIKNDAQALCMVAEAHIDFNSNIEERFGHEGNALAFEDLNTLGEIRWQHITQALDHYTTASKLPNVENLARVHTSRGDCEMLRLRLGEAPFHYKLAQKSERTLVKNASVYYGAATKVLSRDLASSEISDDKTEVDAKAAVVTAWLTADPEILKAFLKGKGSEVRQILEDMRDQGLLGKKSWEQIKKLLHED